MKKSSVCLSAIMAVLLAFAALFAAGCGAPFPEGQPSALEPSENAAEVTPCPTEPDAEVTPETTERPSEAVTEPPQTSVPTEAPLTPAPTAAPTPTAAPDLSGKYVTVELLSEPQIITAFSLPVTLYDSWPMTEYSSDTLTYVPDPEAEIISNAFICGPQDFCIDGEGNFCILDTYGSKVVVVSRTGEILESIRIEGFRYLSQIAYAYGSIWIIDARNNQMIGIKDSIIETYDIPKVPLPDSGPSATVYFAPLIIDFYADEYGRLILDGDSSGVFKFRDGEFSECAERYSRRVFGDELHIRGHNGSWSIPSAGCAIGILGSDPSGNLYVEVNDLFIDDDGSIYGDDTIRVYDANSQPVLAAFVNVAERKILPRNYIKLDQDYCFWELRCYEDRVCMEQIIPAPCVAVVKPIPTN